MNQQDHFVWVEKYRPQKIEDCILPKRMKQTFKEFAAKGQIPNLLLTGRAGVGKTTIARALCEEIGAEVLFINASEENGIDIIRNKIKQFASTVSFSDGIKVVILDEAEGLAANSAQPALRAFIEEFSKNCRFILTANFKNRIIEPLQSRCVGIEFVVEESEKLQLIAKFIERLKVILDKEGIEYDERVVAKLALKFFPDFRKTLNEMQKYASGGIIDEGILAAISDAKFDSLMEHLKEKNFKEFRIWAAQNAANDPARLYRQLYDALYKALEPAHVPQAVLLIAEYGYKAAFAVDQEINLTACLVEISSSCEFK